MPAYYTLCTKHTDGLWHPQFGDKSRRTVTDEKRDCYHGQTVLIVRSASARKSDVDAAILAANEELQKQKAALDSLLTLTEGE